jgi:hypothetical protein
MGGIAVAEGKVTRGRAFVVWPTIVGRERRLRALHHHWSGEG